MREEFNSQRSFLSTPTWPPFHCFATPIWPPWRHVQTLYSVNIALRYGNTSNKNVQLILHDCTLYPRIKPPLSCNKQLVTGCESREYFCIKTCTCCVYYLPRANLFYSKRRTSCVWRDFPRTFVQSEVSIHASCINLICCQGRLQRGC